MALAANDARVVVIDYTNYRGERGVRSIVPREMHFGSTEHHPKPQWLLEAHDVAKNAERTFAVADIHSWTPGNTVPAPSEPVETEAMRDERLANPCSHCGGDGCPECGNTGISRRGDYPT